ncbi:sugar ABC transporter permease [Candidatus Izimaplasma bacterium ZiA1]|uniref:ABC transporter permease n=1 Tax=Candidatus Izimoplasma sp. ZiA1 TaxID=2024899 RepID=UPI000BAA3F5A|nr:sugar ABC transporter permease [Candidatus Izimaplasma bacterium ZiA1]
MKKTISNILNVFMPILLAFLIGAIIMIAIGENPIEVYGILIEKSLLDQKGLLKTIHTASPLILTALAIAISFKANIFNMGVEGQMLLGGFFAGVIGFTFEGLNPVIHITLSIIVGVTVGILFALIPAILKAKFKVNELVVTLMLNYAALEFVRFLAEGPFRDHSSGYVSTPMISESSMFKRLFESEITLFTIIVLIVFVIMYFVFKKTKLGYEIEAIGKNRDFSEATGMNVGKKIIIIFIISGALSGLAGAGHMMSDQMRFTMSFSGNPGLGWDGMLISLLGMHSPLGIIVAAVFYSALITGSESIAVFTSVPREIILIIQSLIILFLSIKMISKNAKAVAILEKITNKILRKDNKGVKK